MQGPPRPYAGSRMEDRGHLPPFTLIRCESAPTSALHSPCIKCLPRAHLPVSCQPWPGWLGSGPSAWARANTPPGLRAQGYRQMDRRGEMPSFPPPHPARPNQHTPSAHSPHSLPDCQASGPGGTRKVGEQPLPPHQGQSLDTRMWGSQTRPSPPGCPSRKDRVPRPPQLCVSLAHTPRWPHLAPSQASSGGSWQSGPSHTYRPQEVPTQHQDSPCG